MARRVAALAIAAGLILIVIGVRFLAVPESAETTFGVASQPGGYELHHIIGLRDLWLGALLVAFAIMKEWRALSLWLGFGSLVCFADAIIAATSSGLPLAVGFHAGSGLFCLALAVAGWRLWAKQRGGKSPDMLAP